MWMSSCLYPGLQEIPDWHASLCSSKTPIYIKEQTCIVGFLGASPRCRPHTAREHPHGKYQSTSPKKNLTMASVDTDTYKLSQPSIPWLLPLQGIILLLCMACSQRPGKSQEISLAMFSMPQCHNKAKNLMATNYSYNNNIIIIITFSWTFFIFCCPFTE